VIVTRKVCKYGVSYGDRYFTNAPLRPYIGEFVLVEPHLDAPARPFLSISTTAGDPICLAFRHGDLTAHEALAILRERAEQRRPDRRRRRRLMTQVEHDARKRKHERGGESGPTAEGGAASEAPDERSPDSNGEQASGGGDA
jgi:hypothetical protein